MEDETIECPNCTPAQLFSIAWKKGDKVAPIMCKICGEKIGEIDLVAEGIVGQGE